MSKPVCESKDMCPLMKSRRELVCHKCAFYIHIRGAHPQTGDEMDVWDCSIALQPLLMIENSRLQHVNNKAILDLRNETTMGNNKRIAADLLRTKAILNARQQT